MVHIFQKEQNYQVVKKFQKLLKKLIMKNYLELLSCISPENYDLNLNEIKNLGIPFGFKLNAFIKTNPKPNYTMKANRESK